MGTKLATFRVDEDLWKSFQDAANGRDTNASSELVKFLKAYLDGAIDLSSYKPLTVEEKNLDKRIEECLDSRLDTVIDKRIEDYLDNHLDSLLDSRIDSGDRFSELAQQFDRLQSQLSPILESQKEVDRLLGK